MNTSNNLPLPYDSYWDNRSIFHSVNEYQQTLMGWKQKNSSRRPIEDDITRMMDAAKSDHINKNIREWMMNHKDKLVYLFDFSGIAFGLVVDERTEEFYIHDLKYASYERLLSYPQFNEKNYESLSILDKLNWLYSNCEFIPIRILTEDFIGSDISHKWSHIKKDNYTLRLLGGYLDNIQYQPRDDVWYYIRVGTYGYYLQRDTELSPKRGNK